MRTLMLIVALLICAVSVQAKGDVVELNIKSIDDAIKNASPQTRHELSRCITNWRSYSERRAKFKALVGRAGKVGGPMLALEIGNSGFGRYDFIVVNGVRVESSFPKLNITSSTTLLDLYRGLRMNQNLDFVDSGSPSEDDGDCFFLMVRKDGEVRTVAVYGTPGATKAGLLIREMLNLAR